MVSEDMCYLTVRVRLSLQGCSTRTKSKMRFVLTNAGSLAHIESVEADVFGTCVKMSVSG